MKEIAGRYEVVQKLGRGLSGEVFAVHDTTIDSVVALKVSFPTEESVHHLEKEFFILAQLDHPNIVRAFDFGRATARRAYFTMSYVNGKPFTHYKFNRKNKFYEAVGKTLSALEFIHARGLIHCDLKPENILIKRGNPRLLDFGLATVPDESAKVRGSIHYIAPELFRGARPDPRADLYSLGVILYSALMHRLPFEGNSVSDLMVSHVRSKPTRIRKRSVDPGFGDIVMKLLEVDPNYRYESVEAVLDDFRALLPEFGIRPGRSALTHVYTSPLVGRQKQLARLEYGLRECAKGTSQFFFIVGPEGAGKTRLVKEARRTAQVIGLSTQVIGLSGAGSVRLGQDVPRTAPSLLVFEDAHLLDSGRLGELSKLLKTESDKPVALVVTCSGGKDYQRLRERFSSAASWNQILLKHLSEEETRSMVEGMLLRMQNPLEIVSAVFRLSGGLPLLIEEAVKNLVRSGVVEKKRGRWYLPPDRKTGTTSPGEGSWIMARQLESIDEDEARILDIASLLDEGVSLETLEKVSGEDAQELKGSLVSLASLGLMRRLTGGRFAVANRYLSSYVRSSFPARRKKDLHRRIGEAFGDSIPVVSAKHFMLAGDRKRAYQIAVEEGARLELVGRTEEACRCYEIALGASGDPREKFDALKKLAYLYDGLSNHDKAIGAATTASEIGSRMMMDIDELLVKTANIRSKREEYPEAERLLHEVLTRVKDKAILCSALCELAWLEMETDRNREALQTAKKARDVAERVKDELCKARVYHTLGTIRWCGGKLDVSQKLMRKAVELKVKLGLHSSAADSLNNLGVICWTMGEMHEAERAYRQALREFERAGDRGGIAAILTNIGLVEWTRGDWSAALADYEKAYDIQEELGDQAALARLDNLIGVAEENLGNWRKALVHFRRHLRYNQTHKDRRGLAVSLNSLGSLLLKTGAFGEARETFEKCLRIRREIEDLEGEGLCLLNLAMVKKEVGDLEGARTDIERCIRISRRAGIEKDLGSAYRIKAEILLEVGKEVEASRAASGALNLSKKTEDKLELSQVYRVMAKLAGTADKEKERLHRKGVEIARTLDARYELGRGLFAYGQFLLEVDGRLNEAVARLRDATDIFEHLGAERDLDLTRAACSEAVARIASMRGFGAGMLQVSALSEIAGLIGAVSDIHRFYGKVVDAMVSLLGAERGLLLLFSENGDELEVAAQSSMDRATVKDATVLSRGVVKEAAEKGIPVICDDAFTDPRFNQNRSVVLNNIHSLLCVPLLLRDEVLGTLYVDSRLDRRLFSKDDIPFVSALASMMAVAIDSARYRDEIMRENVQLKSEILGRYGPGSIIGTSDAMRNVFETVNRVAGTDSTVLIEGETGTGKELVARAIHYQSGRAGKRFLTIDCGALPESLLESEMFGHQKGSFTGAVANKKGLFEVADGGTVFLDEIGDAPQSVQSRLLRVLERSEVRRIGESRYRKVDVRVVCATNKNLAAEVKAARFRKDLYFRLKVLNMELPPLRERREDIIPLADHFVERMKNELGKEIAGITPDGARTLIAYPWPGNVRELQNEIARACTLVPEACAIARSDLSPVVRGESAAKDDRHSLPYILEGVEKRVIAEALRRNGWNKTRAADELGLSRQGLLKKMARLGVTGKKTK